MKRVLVMLMVAALATAAQAWTLVDDFESYSTGDTATVTGGVWSSKVNDSTSEIAASGSGQVLQISKLAGSGGWDGSDKDLTGIGAALAVGETQTYFWQVSIHTDWETTSWTYDCMMGLSPDVSNIDQVNAWQDFSVMPFINNAPATPYINANAPTSPWWAPMAMDTWTNVWVVVNNDAVDPTFDLYYSTGTDAPVLVAGDADWRNFAAGVDLNAIGFMAGGWDLSSYSFDNIYYADGEDLTNPVPEPVTMVLLGFGSLALLRRRK